MKKFFCDKCEKEIPKPDANCVSVVKGGIVITTRFLKSMTLEELDLCFDCKFELIHFISDVYKTPKWKE